MTEVEDTRITWRELDPHHDWPDDPDSLVELNGHNLWRYDPEKAETLIRTCQQLGGSQFRSSPELAYMLVGDEPWSAFRFGFHIAADESLPAGTVVPA